MPESLIDLEQQRNAIVQQMLRLPDFRSGSITATRGTCGKANCRCHQPNQPGHGPRLAGAFSVLDGLPVGVERQQFRTRKALQRRRIVAR